MLDCKDKNQGFKGISYEHVGSVKMQNCITENAVFMSGIKLELKMNHPYKKGNAKQTFRRNNF